MSNVIHAEAASLAWARLAAMPARYVHPVSLSKCFDDALAMDLIVQMQANPRIQSDLKTLLAAKHGLEALPDNLQIEDFDLAIVLLSSDELTGFFRACGATMWANAIAAEIRASTILELKRRIGERAYRSALRNRDLSFTNPATTDVETLTANIERDGATCLASWIGWLPTSLQGWIRLKLPPSQMDQSSLVGEAEARAKEIVTRLATAVAHAEDRV